MDRKKGLYLICLGALIVVTAFFVARWPSDSQVETDTASDPIASSEVQRNRAARSSEENNSSPVAGVRISSVPEYNDQLSISHESFPEGMPFADLMDHAREHWGFNFDRFYREEPTREPWADWEAAALRSLEAYFTHNMEPVGGWTDENAWYKEDIADYVMFRYQMLREQGVSLADAPTALELMRLIDRGESSIYDKPTVRIHLDGILFRPDGSFGGYAGGVTYEGGASGGLSLREIIEDGVVPEGLRVIYIDKNDQEKPPGWRPPEIKPPSERAKWMSDEQLRASVHLFETDMRLSPEKEARLLEWLENSRTKAKMEAGLFSVISAWKERPSAWRLPPPDYLDSAGAARSDSSSGPPSGKLSAPPENRPPRLPPPSAPESAPDDVMDRGPGPPRPDPNAAPSADDLGRMQEAVKRAESGGDLSDEERSLLRLKGLYDLYEAEQKRLRRGFESPRSSESSP